MPSLGCYRLARTSGVYPVHYLTINMTTQRDSQSWWVELTTDYDQATKWQVERTEENLLKIWCDLDGRTPVFLAAHGSCRGECTDSVGPHSVAALVHCLDDDDALWAEQIVDVKGTRILRKAKANNEGYALTGLCFPEALRHDCSFQGSGPRGFWRALPFVNVVIRSTVTLPHIDQHVLWTPIRIHDNTMRPNPSSRRQV